MIPYYETKIENFLNITNITLSCLQTDANWYLGEDCKYQVHKVGFYAGVAVVAVVLLIAIAMLSAYVFLNKRKEKRNKDNKEALVNQWIDDDFEWSSQKRTNTSLSARVPQLRTTSSTERYFPQFNLPENEISLPSLHNNYPVSWEISKTQSQIN
ncbi:hypothetical protein Q7C36_004654 [Tachysurus vachellii]|uniref:Uncharacterized protein n=1 Tax=Tachysurus vachellii TaxID=175792 RepID=A0AA88NMV2_TACVA|nr:hypothetical protein Q7C36_004654 [Tachysurus vachellii]